MVLKAISPHDHSSLLPQYHEALGQLRNRFLIPETYRIDLQLVCPKQMPTAYAATTFDYLPNRCYTIRVHCNLKPDQIRWALTHEFLEILLADLGRFTDEEISSHKAKALVNFLDVRHRELRDEAIEHLTHIILNEPRPLLAS